MGGPPSTLALVVVAAAAAVSSCSTSRPSQASLSPLARAAPVLPRLELPRKEEQQQPTRGGKALVNITEFVAAFRGALSDAMTLLLHFVYDDLRVHERSGIEIVQQFVEAAKAAVGAEQQRNNLDLALQATLMRLGCDDGKMLMEGVSRADWLAFFADASAASRPAASSSWTWSPRRRAAWTSWQQRWTARRGRTLLRSPRRASGPCARASPAPPSPAPARRRTCSSRPRP